MVQVGIYAPDIDPEQPSAPQQCVLRLATQLVEAEEHDVTFVTHGQTELANVGDTLVVPRTPVRCERAMNGADFDFVQFYTLTDLRLPVLLDAETVLVYHGDLHWEFPAIYGRAKSYATRAVELAKFPQYDQIVCVSEDLETRVQRRYSGLVAETATVYNGVSRPGDCSPERDPLLTYGVDTPYVLHVSNFTEKKNPEGIFESFALVRQETTEDVMLIVCGGGWTDDDGVRELIGNLGIENDVVLTGYVPEAELEFLYERASVFVYPSLHETFGLPIIEAMARGTAVVTSDSYAMPEVAGGAAVLCDPMSPRDIADGVVRLLENEETRRRYERDGLERSDEFGWERAAEEMSRIYRDSG